MLIIDNLHRIYYNILQYKINERKLLNMIYLDNAATTKPYPAVIETITDVLTNHWGNSGASYEFGDNARRLINEATQLVANDINCNPEEIIWTSGATESNTMGIMGVLEANPHMFFFTSKMEHSSIVEIAKNLSGHAMFFFTQR